MKRETSFVWKAIVVIILIQESFVHAQVKTTSSPSTKITNSPKVTTSAAPATKNTNPPATKATNPSPKSITTTLTTVLNSTPSAQCNSLGGRRCIFPFKYEARTYNGCTDIDDTRLWCATSVDLNGFVRDFGFCTTSCPVATIPPSTVCQTKTGYDCILPFNYCGITYNGCTGKDNQGVGWCATSVNQNGETVNWDECSNTCPRA